MEKKEDIVTIFARCFRSLNKSGIRMGDGFFSDLCANKSDKLLSEFIFLLEERSGNGYVAQCRDRMVSYVEDFLEFIRISKHLKLTELTTSLLAEQNLLNLKLHLLDLKVREIKLVKTEKPVRKIEKKPKATNELSLVHKQITSFISQNGKTQNLDVFKKFSIISKRTLKRKLSELIQADSIKRITEGKKVFYSPVKPN